MREDEFAAQAMGINVSRVKVLAFVLAAFFAGTAGGLYAHEFGLNISPEDAGFQRSFDYLIMTVLGGRGSITGVMLAAMILTSLPELLRGFSEYRLIAYALLLIGMMLVRPQGLFGIHEIWDFWPGKSRKQDDEQGVGRRTVGWLIPRPCSELPVGHRRHRHFVWRAQGGSAFFDSLAARCAVWPDRPERRGQDDRLQLADRRLSRRWAGGWYLSREASWA